jgi:spore coat polysaccharide biosynthesis protein SpsF (cytidylyltransferase family)
LDEDDPDREHVCDRVYASPSFTITNYEDEEDNSDLRWCVDDFEDFQRVGAIIERWGDLPYREIIRRVRWTTD